MATYVDQAYYGWEHDDISHQEGSQEISASQMLDHGSISFGRFAYESLSWERRSVFTHNKCQEELEKFKCPGLVAKKKAYFEEYYKRIRAMKASQENQQTELTLDYGGDESISSQNGEEDETAVHLGNHGEGTSNIVDGQPVEVVVEISTEKQILELHDNDSDLGTTAINLGSLRSNYKDLEQENHTKYPPDIKDTSAVISVEKEKEIVEISNRHLVPENTTRNLDSLTCNKLDTEHQDLESPVKVIEVTEHLDIEVTEHHDISNIDNEDVPREMSKTCIEPEEDPNVTDLNPSNSKFGDLELKSVKTMVSEKDTTHVRNHKGDVPVHKVKEPYATCRNGSKLEYKAKPDVGKSSRGPNYASQRTPKQSGNFAGSSKTPAVEVSRSYNSPYTPTRRPLTAVHSTVAILRPFPLSTDRRSAVVSGNGGGPLKSDHKASNKRISLAVHRKDAVSVQVNSKKTIMTAGVQSRGLENKSGYEERKKPLPMDRQRIGLKDRGAKIPEPSKTRSVNLPPRKTCTSSTVANNKAKMDLRALRQKENKGEAGSREVCRSGKSVAAPPAQITRCETKMVPSWAGNHSTNGKKSRFVEQSLDGKKPRLEKPCWR